MTFQCIFKMFSKLKFRYTRSVAPLRNSSVCRLCDVEEKRERKYVTASMKLAVTL